MSEEKKNIEFENQAEEQKELKKNIFRDVLNGSFIVKDMFLKQWPFFIFIAFLAIVYIANRYHAEKLYRKTILLQNEIKEMRAESISTASDLMFVSKQSEVSKAVDRNNIGLKESVSPPIKIDLED